MFVACAERGDRAVVRRAHGVVGSAFAGRQGAQGIRTLPASLRSTNTVVPIALNALHSRAVSAYSRMAFYLGRVDG